MNEVARWLEGNASLTIREKDTPLKRHSARRKGIRRGAKLMFISGVLFPVFFLFGIVVGLPALLFIPFFIFFVGLSRMLYSRIFGKEISSIKPEQTEASKLGSMHRNKSLPSVNGIWIKRTAEQQFQTAELVKPPSITEHTTTLLDKN
ncbi:MAG TPA: hypothetical protein VER14_05165 [Phototrophicaceae bacterium]|nr:hypothetical protein [Phototrophicaceae bacterium]